MTRFSMPFFCIFLLGTASISDCTTNLRGVNFLGTSTKSEADQLGSLMTLGDKNIAVKKESVMPKKVDFLTSMGWDLPENAEKRKRYFGTNPNTSPQNKINKLYSLKALYDKNHFAEKSVQGKPVIPKVVHYIWLGPNKPPAVFEESQKSVAKYLPDWECKIWTDKDVPGLRIHNKKYYDLSKNYGEKADILRYEILFKYGGMYLDVDFILLKSLDVLLQYDLWASIQPIDCRGDIANGIIASIPGHPILRDCIHTLGADWEAFDSKPMRLSIFDKVGPRHFQKSFIKFVNDKSMNIIALPTSYFYPIDFTNRLLAIEGSEKVESFIKPESFAIHYWAGTWWDAKAE